MTKSYISVEIIDPLTLSENIYCSFKLTRDELIYLTKKSGFSMVKVRMADHKELRGQLCLIHNSIIKEMPDV